MKLRDYQEEAVEATVRSFCDNQTALWVMPTGTGKTIAFAHLAKRFADKGQIMVLAHRKELIYQARDRIADAVGLDAQVEMADQRATRTIFATPVVVSTVQTQIAGTNGYHRFQRFDPNEFSLLIVDEAHHATQPSYRTTIDYYRQNTDLKVLGVTATPNRHDERALGLVFEDVPFTLDLLDAIELGWLTPVEQEMIECEHLDFSACKTTGGDLNGADLARVMEVEEALQEITAPTLEIVGDRKAIVFAASVAHAERMCEIINRARPHAATYVQYKTPADERDERIKRFREGEYQYFLNVGIATEGFDVPDTEVIVQARPTKSLPLYTQMIGRGTRPLSGLVDGLDTPEERRMAIASSSKPSVLVLDFVGNAGRHKLVSCMDALGGNYDDDVIELATRKAREDGRPANVEDALREAARRKRELAAEEEAARRRHIQAKARYRSRKVSPFDALDLIPRREKAWEKGRKPTDPQVNFLLKMKVPNVDKMSFAQAHHLCGVLIQRMRAGLCTWKMANTLKGFGYDGDNMKMPEAKAILNLLSANNWRPIR